MTTLRATKPRDQFRFKAKLIEWRGLAPLVLASLLLFVMASASAATILNPATTWGFATTPYVSTLTPSIWTKKPTDADFNAAYPANAHGVGNVNVYCLLAADGSLTRCAVQAEAPENQGFGAAALSLTPLYRAQQRAPDGFKSVTFTIRFTRVGESTAGSAESCIPPSCVREPAFPVHLKCSSANGFQFLWLDTSRNSVTSAPPGPTGDADAEHRITFPLQTWPMAFFFIGPTGPVVIDRRSGEISWYSDKGVTKGSCTRENLRPNYPQVLVPPLPALPGPRKF